MASPPSHHSPAALPRATTSAPLAQGTTDASAVASGALGTSSPPARGAP